MADYAGLVCLMNTIENVQNHPLYSICLQHEQIQSLQQTLDFLLDFVENYSHVRGYVMDYFECAIAKAAYAAVDVIESHVVDHIVAENSSISLLDLQKVIQGMDAAKDKVILAFGDHRMPAEDRVTDLGQALARFSSGGPYENLLAIVQYFDSYRKDIMKVIEERGFNLEEKSSCSTLAEDVIESHVVDQIVAEDSSNFLLDQQKLLIQAMDSIQEIFTVPAEDRITDPYDLGQALPRFSSGPLQDLPVIRKCIDAQKKIMMIRDVAGYADESFAYEALRGLGPVIESLVNALEESGKQSAYPRTTGRSATIGFDGYLFRLMDALTGQQSSQKIISITGMAGIGKTTLAKNAYENLVVVQHFDFRAWAVVSQNSNVKKILLQLLSCRKELGNRESIVASKNQLEQQTEDELGEQLYKFLSGKRYLIVLDDIWSIETWENIKFFFPKNNSESRIVATTRQSHVAIHFGSSVLKVGFLDENSSWKLFCDRAFAQEGCPPELEEVAKKIVVKCEGLPLSIVVMGGLLRKSKRSQEYWENIAEHITEDIGSIIDLETNDHASHVLFLSYVHLPAHLKPCFLYMGLFQDLRVRVSDLIKFWIAEGFLKSNKVQSLEEVAEGYIQDLVDRNLILVDDFGLNGKIRTCYINDLSIDLCLRVLVRVEIYFSMIEDEYPMGIGLKAYMVSTEKIMNEGRKNRLFHLCPSDELLPSLISEGGVPISFKNRLLPPTFLDERHSLDALLQQVNLRCIFAELHSSEFQIALLPRSISRLWNLQTINLRGAYHLFLAPYEIWEMRQLRHLMVDDINFLPDPRPSDFSLLNLQTLKTILNFKLSEEVCRRIPNIKKLYILYTDFSTECEASSYYSTHNLSRLRKLRSLKCVLFGAPNGRYFMLSFTFPSSLQKLCLNGCGLNWKDLTIIGSLPHLAVLKLENNAVTGSEWNPVEGEFLRLNVLKIHSCRELLYWNADRSHFPVMETLILDELEELDEIPLDFGEITTLRVIRMNFCSESAGVSAMKILEEQESMGNEDLQIRVKFKNKADFESFSEKVEPDTLASLNFQAEVALRKLNFDPLGLI